MSSYYFPSQAYQRPNAPQYNQQNSYSNTFLPYQSLPPRPPPKSKRISTGISLLIIVTSIAIPVVLAYTVAGYLTSYAENQSARTTTFVGESDVGSLAGALLGDEGVLAESMLDYVVGGNAGKEQKESIVKCGVKDAKWRGRAKNFSTPFNRIALASYPRSGNTFLRTYLERLFGIYTGSIQNDTRLGQVFPGEGHTSPSKVLFVKTHEPFFYKPTTDDIPYDAAIYIVRNPFESIMSFWHYLKTKRHDGSISNGDDSEIGLERMRKVFAEPMNRAWIMMSAKNWLNHAQYWQVEEQAYEVDMSLNAESEIPTAKLYHARDSEEIEEKSFITEPILPASDPSSKSSASSPSASAPKCLIDSTQPPTRICRSFQPSKFLTIRYEDLLTQPMTELERIVSFMSLQNDPYIKARLDCIRDTHDEREKEKLSVLKRRGKSDGVEVKGVWGRVVIDEVKKVTKEGLCRFGYEGWVEGILGVPVAC
ncbi:hypothetical protein BKA69DRAFT_1124622 [Paraphysoderma sedebokerense]|nr:hypothetical protein BKA69DRAFT_1124622 [Paraphysoderma sedebokerense]